MAPSSVQRRRRHQATLALAVAVSGGTAFAASTLIKGSQIAPGTITAANIKEHTLTQADFALGQRLPAAAAATPPMPW